MKRALITIALVGCGSHKAEPEKPTRPGPDDPAATIRAVASAYAKWGRVDEQPRQAPQLCAAPAPPPSGLRVSAATEGPHGTKLYYLYANDRAAYQNHTAAVGFQIVKESFAAVPSTNAGHPTVDIAGQKMMAGAETGLFVMAKVGTPDSDAGWIYGTTTADGKVTSAGRVATCMGCHEDAPSDRLFGVRMVLAPAQSPIGPTALRARPRSAVTRESAQPAR